MFFSKAPGKGPPWPLPSITAVSAPIVTWLSFLCVPLSLCLFSLQGHQSFLMEGSLDSIVISSYLITPAKTLFLNQVTFTGTRYLNFNICIGCTQFNPPQKRGHRCRESSLLGTRASFRRDPYSLDSSQGHQQWVRCPGFFPWGLKSEN